MIALLLAPVFTAAGQQQPGRPAPATQSVPPLRVTSRLVQIDVIVQDRSGKPITDLKKGDFTILDQGKEQQVSVFALESLGKVSMPAEPLPPNTFSNRIEQRTGAPTSVTVILLDALNTRIQDQQYARDNIIQFLEKVPPGERIALYVMTHDHIRVLHSFTSDSSSLLKALARYKGRHSANLDASEPDDAETGIAQLDEFLQEANQRMANFYMIDRVLTTINAFEAVANHLARFPGRKNLVWVSSSFPINMGYNIERQRTSLSVERRSFYREAERAARAISNANIAVYPVDARGLAGAPDNFRVIGRGPTSSIDANIDAMQFMAQRTGGRAFYNRNDIDGAILTAIKDTRVTYLLGYYPTHGKWDGNFHEIKVKVNRPGAKVRHRGGYYAATDQVLEEKERQQLLGEAARSPLDATSLGLVVRAEPRTEPGPPALDLAVQVTTSDLTLRLVSERWTGALDVLVQQRASDGRVVDGQSQTINLNLKQENYERIQKGGLTMRETVELKLDATEIRIVVRDVPTGAMGSLIVPLKR